ncbi:hypothetical protein B0T24DRAFT_528810 [Lasiosphaeria ovina]|uniref:Uncharacterized protein n=1 Tax=Lasiosphaeria ovina TaxID=92902 RepID=A0AAE0KAX2_9PEZI|nr:hypothetical protein B0T24DRAFT_528810 [Lasiosphaeria ovina]
MTTGAEFKPALSKMGTSQLRDPFGADSGRLGTQPRMFKKHKVLPHPRKDGQLGIQPSGPRKLDVGTKALLSRSSGPPGSSPRSQKSIRAGGGPEPPPTPPAHSRTSSSSHSVKLASPTYVSSPLQSAENVSSRPPATPTNQQTPPTPNLTPDRTPPGPSERRANKPRPPISDRIPSKVTIDSRTESFRTAPENPYSSDDEDDGRSTLRPIIPSAKTSQSTVRQVSAEVKTKPQPIGLGLGLESSPGGELTPKTAKEFNTFDGEWGEGGGSSSEVEEEWDYNLGRNVMVKKRRPTKQASGFKDEVFEDQATVTPTNATKALRSISLQESPLVYPSRRVVSDQLPARTAPSNSESSISIDLRRSSIMSTKSTASTVVEAILVETVPQRRKTLRHVRKQITLRDSSSDLSPASSAPTSISATVDDSRRPRLSSTKVGEAPRQSYTSINSVNSVSSRKARREVWKNGGIPVVVVPDRRSSVKSNSKEPSLRSASSRKSKRSQSLNSVSASQVSKPKDNVPMFERPVRRSRTLSESDGSRSGDQRTIDFPPPIPTRSSSLSAPTSRNASRTGSLTTESLRAHNAFQVQQAHHALQKAHEEIETLQGETPLLERDDNTHDGQQSDRESTETPLPIQVERPQPEVTIQRVPSTESKKSRDEPQPQSSNEPEVNEDHGHRLSVDRYGDPFFGKRLSVQNTPFSLASVDTTGTSHAEVSEAMAVNIYPHQNKSLMIVEHSARPSESSSLERYKTSETETPTIRAIDVDSGNGIPVTPPQTFSMDDVDSPLRNPRAPPEPPSLQFIPATPSGLTPTTEKEKMLGNFFEMAEEEPKRGLSLLRRTLSRRRTSEYGPSPSRPVGLLTRTFSLSRSIRKGREGEKDERPGLRRHSTADDGPADENRLHPFWQPAYIEDSDSDPEDWYEETPVDRTYKYPTIDNRPALPRRGLSARMKKTFAILPSRDEYEDTSATRDAPERRTIRRTPSGNLRVMKFRRSMESLTRLPLHDGRPYTAPEQRDGGGRHLRFWRSPSLSRAASGPKKRASAESVKKSGSGFLPTLGKRINFPRRMSERRRTKRTEELRRMISGPREVRDGVGDVIRRTSYRETYYEQQQKQQQLLLLQEQQEQRF